MKLIKEINKLPFIGIMLIICIAAATLLFSVILPLYRSSNEMGKNVGMIEGKAVGLVTGSYKGFTEGDAKGKEDALSAEDITAHVADRMNEVGNLEVLVAGIRLKNVHSVGDKYKALYLIAGDAVFTVDIAKVKVSASSDGELLVVIPKPEMQLYIDERKTERLANSQKAIFNGSSEDGFTAYINTMTATVEEVEKALSNYDELMKAAQESAVAQVDMIVKSVCGSGITAHISLEA